MRLRTVWIILWVCTLFGLALAKLPKNERLMPQLISSENENPSPVAVQTAPERGPARRSLDDPIGTLDTCGTTWYDEQQYTTMGKQIAVDAMGYVHHVWTKGMANGSVQRRIYYNAWNPATSNFFLPNTTNPIGVRVDNSYKAGYVNLAVDQNGIAYPAYHAIAVQGQTAHTVVGIDYNAHLGGFALGEIPYADDQKIIYPKIACDISGNLQVVATEGLPANFGYYAHGVPSFSEGNGDSVHWEDGFVAADSTYFLTRDIATSFHSNRVAIAWLFWDSRESSDWYGVNLFVKTSTDGGTTWGAPINVTNYPAIDTNCVNNGGAVEICNGDSLRPYTDLSVIFDQNDVLHIAFTARPMFYWDVDGSVGPWIHNNAISSIWHWDEQHQEFNIMAERPYGTLNYSVGKTQSMCHRPNLAIDTTTGYLYCSYQMFDTTQYSESGYEQADAYVTVSTDGGRTWSAGTNVTNTNGGEGAAPGDSRSERDISLAEFVTGGIIHMQYQLDLDAGTAINTEAEGTPTNNPIVYQRIPVSLIPTRPLINPYRTLRNDSTGYPRGLDTTGSAVDLPTLLPGQFALYQNYPNPFNPTTSIQFDLSTETMVSLRIFDVTGREVTSLVHNERMAAGAHVLSFDGSAMASGVYFYRLETPTSSQTRKMVLMK